MLEMAEGTSWGSTAVLKSQVVSVQYSMWTRAVEYATIRPQNSLFGARKSSQRQFYKESSRAFTTELTLSM